MKSITFLLNSQYFGIEISNIIEVVKEYQIKQIPGVSNVIEGLINLRGEIITVVNLKKRLKLEETKDSIHDVLIVRYDNINYGLYLDEVLEVVNLKEENIQKESKNFLKIEENFLENLAKLNEKPIMILNLEQILDI
ncbi:chemotaxis protein CheW [bacterium]|nr:chemotaxis protein CheW [bacterium]